MKIFKGKFRKIAEIKLHVLKLKFISKQTKLPKKSFVLDWFTIQKEITTPIEQQTKADLNTCLQTFYVSIRQTIGEPEKVSSLKAIRAAIDKMFEASCSLPSVIINLRRQIIRSMQPAKI